MKKEIRRKGEAAEEVPMEERKRMVALAEFTENERKEGDLAAYWRATNLLSGAMREAGVAKSFRERYAERVKKRFLGWEEEEIESYSTKIWSALEKTGVPPPYARDIARLVANKWFAKHRSGELAKAIFLRQKDKILVERTPRAYDRLAERIYRLINHVLNNPVSAKTGRAQAMLNRIKENHMNVTKRDVLSINAVLAMELLERPGRLAKVLAKNDEAFEEYVRRRHMEEYKKYKERAVRLAAMINQLESALFFMKYKLPHIPPGTTQIESISQIREGHAVEDFERAKKMAEISQEEYYRALAETLKAHGLKPQDVHFTSVHDAMERLEEMKKELEEMFPHIRKKLKEKETS